MNEAALWVLGFTTGFGALCAAYAAVRIKAALDLLRELDVDSLNTRDALSDLEARVERLGSDVGGALERLPKTRAKRTKPEAEVEASEDAAPAS